MFVYFVTAARKRTSLSKRRKQGIYVARTFHAVACRVLSSRNYTGMPGDSLIQRAEISEAYPSTTDGSLLSTPFLSPSSLRTFSFSFSFFLFFFFFFSFWQKSSNASSIARCIRLSLSSLPFFLSRARVFSFSLGPRADRRKSWSKGKETEDAGGALEIRLC